MARLVSTILLLAVSTFSSAAFGADTADRRWSAPEKPIPTLNFSISDDGQAVNPDRTGARIIAGREVMPNGVVGVGFFGHKSADPSLSPVTARELAIPKQRKAAVGFSLRF